MPLTRRLSQFFSSSSHSLPLPGKDMNTIDTTASTPTSSPPSISEEVIISSTIIEEAEDKEELSQVSVEQSPNATKRPRRKTIRKIFRRFSFHSSPKDSTSIPRTLSSVNNVVLAETPLKIPALTTTN
ncbi:hypothetical protein EYC84_010352 [Monilinia fructicola]|uniref:Uncharacterized protein n=1 Tax=Monilinia fructicola TaxID=38448 RepID=A0A5M9JDH9_MONFR|nr:hypothetical protein EYC84_010352 [Monilinia fructicola]